VGTIRSLQQKARAIGVLMYSPAFILHEPLRRPSLTPEILRFTLSVLVDRLGAPMPHASSDTEDRKLLEDIQQQLVRAWVTHDRSILDRLLAPEWMVTQADGRLSSRQDILRDFDTGSNRLLDGNIDDIRVRLFDNFAVVTGRTQARGEYKGHPYDVTLRFTDVFLRRPQGWQAVASHATRLAAADTTNQEPVPGG
jgi:hypothetical protein